MEPTCPTGLTDARWAIPKPLVPTARDGRPRTADVRGGPNGIFHRCRSGCRSGCRWRTLPEEYGPHQAVHNYHRHGVLCGVWERIGAALRRAVRGPPGGTRRRAPGASAAGR